MLRRISPFIAILTTLLLPLPAFAHEQYVLTKQQLALGMSDKTLNVLSALNSPENVKISIFVGIGITILVFLYFVFQYSRLGITFNKQVTKLEPFGHILLRVALAGALISSAYFHSFLGPEIPITSIPGGNILIPVMYILGVLLLLGLWTRFVAIAALCILLRATFIYGDYMVTYFNYYGEILAFIIFGSYVLSVDDKLYGISSLIKKYKNWEIALIRITYGISVMYPAITIKLMHPMIIVMIVYQYHLNQIHWLFPQDPLLISLGTGLAQVLVGSFIIFGFETRLASLVTFLLYLLSVLYFKEAVWPHYVLLALGFYLIINNGGELTLDHLIVKRISIWKKQKSRDRR